MIKEIIYYAWKQLQFKYLYAKMMMEFYKLSVYDNNYWSDEDREVADEIAIEMKVGNEDIKRILYEQLIIKGRCIRHTTGYLFARWEALVETRKIIAKMSDIVLKQSDIDYMYNNLKKGVPK